jgi:hypothetical protein
MFDLLFNTFVELQDRIVNDHAPDSQSARLVGLLFMRQGQETADKEILPSLEYFDVRSGPQVHFYLPGWEKLVYGREVPRKVAWTFKVQEFVKACNVIAAATSWRYSGGVDLLLFTSRLGHPRQGGSRAFLDLSGAVNLPLHEMKERKMGVPSVLFERIFSYAEHYSGDEPLAGLSMQEARVSGVQAFIDAIISHLAKDGKERIDYARNFIVRDISKKDESREITVGISRTKR